MTTVQRPRILIVEDSAPTLNILKFTFERRGYEVLTAADGEAGLSLARESSPDAILLDVMLPKKSGLEICAELKADARRKYFSQQRLAELMIRELKLPAGVELVVMADEYFEGRLLWNVCRGRQGHIFISYLS